MASKPTNPPNARVAIEQYLQNHSGWHEVATIVNVTGYSNSHVLSTGTAMAKSNNSPVEKRKNYSKPVVAYICNGNWEFPGSNRLEYIRLIRQYANSPPANLHSMSLERLQSELRKIADGTAVPEHKVEFRVP